MTPTQRRQRLRSILAGPVLISPATVYDALSARVAESVGYEVGVLSGSVSGATFLAAPDLALQTLTEFAHQVRQVTRASNISVMLDADHGYGNALNVMRCVQELEHAGTAAMMIEDTVMPARFGADDLEVISLEEQVGKLRAALAAREDPSLILIARTASLKVEDLERCVARVKAYAATGVDAVFLTGVENIEQFDALRAAIKAPIISGSAPKLAREDLAARGVRLMLQGHQPIAAIVKTLQDVYTHLYKGGRPAELGSKLASAEDMARVTKNAQYEAWRQEFLR